MIQVDHDIFRITAGIETFTTEIRDATSLESNYLSDFIVLMICYIAPQRYPDAYTAFISDNQSALLSLISISQINHASHPNFYDDPYHINRLLLNHLLYIFKHSERKTVAFDPCIVAALLDYGAVVKSETILILYRCVSLVCKFD